MVEVTQSDMNVAATFLEEWEPGPEMTVVKLARVIAAVRIAERERNAGIAEEGTQPGCDDPECSFNCLERRAIAQAIRAASDD